MIDYPLLGPALTDAEIAEGCRMARDWKLACVVVRPCDVDQALRILSDGAVAVGSTVGYPDGTSVTGTKLYEGRDLLRRGAKELDFAISVPKMIGRQFQYVETELLQMAKSCLESGAVLKVNLRTDILDSDLCIIATKICKRVEAAMLSIAGSARDYEVIVPILKDRIGMKLAADVTTLDEALSARARGVQRITSSNPSQILSQWKARLEEQQQAPASI